MRHFLFVLLTLSFACNAWAEKTVYFSDDSPSLVLNRLKMALEQEPRPAGDLYFRGEKIYIVEKDKKQEQYVAYEIEVHGTIFGRSYVDLVEKQAADFIDSNIDEFMTATVENRDEARLKIDWHPAEDDMGQPQYPGIVLRYKELIKRNDALDIQIQKLLSMEMKNPDSSDNARVQQAISMTQQLIDDMQQTFDSLDPDIQESDIADGGAFGLGLHDNISKYKTNLAEIEKYWGGDLKSKYETNSIPYRRVKDLLFFHHGHGESEDSMYSGAFCVTSDGKSVIAGYTNVLGHVSPMVLEFDENHKVLEHVVYSGEPSYRATYRAGAEVEAGNFLIAGEATQAPFTAGMLIKFNRTTGDHIWQKDFQSIVFNGVIYDPQGAYYALGRTHDGKNSANNNFYIAKLDLRGEILWEKRFGGHNGPDSAISGVLLSDHSLVVTGYATATDDYSSRGMMCRIDNTGKLLWQDTFGLSGTSFVSVTQTSGNHLLAVGTYQVGKTKKAVVLKTTLEGKKLWQKNLLTGEFDNENSQAKAVVAVSDGIIIVGSIGKGALIKKIDRDGNKIWVTGYGGRSEDGDVFEAVQVAKDGSILVAGTTSSFASKSSGKNIWMIPLKADGELPDPSR